MVTSCRAASRRASWYTRIAKPERGGYGNCAVITRTASRSSGDAAGSPLTPLLGPAQIAVLGWRTGRNRACAARREYQSRRRRPGAADLDAAARHGHPHGRARRLGVSRRACRRLPPAARARRRASAGCAPAAGPPPCGPRRARSSSSRRTTRRWRSAGPSRPCSRRRWRASATRSSSWPTTARDDTAAIAAAAGARVLVRDAPDARGKGQALRWAMDLLLAEDAPLDAFVVVDADTEADPDFLASLPRRVRGTAPAPHRASRCSCPTRRADRSCARQRSCSSTGCGRRDAIASTCRARCRATACCSRAARSRRIRGTRSRARRTSSTPSRSASRVCGSSSFAVRSFALRRRRTHGRPSSRASAGRGGRCTSHAR